MAQITFMLFRDKSLDSVEEKDLQVLVDNGIGEAKTIEYKETLPGRSDSDRKEFLADISSFANAAGGHLVYGVRAQAGIPIDLCGLHSTDTDAEILRLEEMTRDGIRPRIPGIQFQPISLKRGTFAIITRIPKSWASPHQVIYQKTFRFFSRGVNGKYPLDVDELREAFILSETVTDRIKRFRVDRLSKIIANETPILLGLEPKVVIHIVPFSALITSERYDIFAPGIRLSDKLLPPYNIGAHKDWERRYNFDGLLISSERRAYTQIFRNGIIEAVNSQGYHLFSDIGTDKEFININLLEDMLLYFPSIYIAALEQMGVEPPIVVMLSLLGVTGLPVVQYLQTQYGDSPQEIGTPIDRAELILPELLVEDLSSASELFMRPALDMIWNAAGEPMSRNYAASGERIRKTNYYSQ
jgi:hypothetical protein